MASIAILGAGGFGTSLAVTAFKYGHAVTLWSKFPEEVKAIRDHGENRKLLPGIPVDTGIVLSSDLNDVRDKDIVLFAVPSFAVRETAHAAGDYVSKKSILVNVAKGLEAGSLKRLSEVIREELPDNKTVVLSGPSHAEEIARGVPTTLVAASDDRESAEYIQDTLVSGTLRIYVSDDCIGVELGGALKNVIALCAGICDGMQLGDNAKAALMTRGIAEISRLGVALGGNEITFSGLAGIGDLIVTCMSMHSRNRRAGILIGEGMPTEQAVERVGTVEGYNAAKLALALAHQQNVTMPITEQLCTILYENAAPAVALQNLMARPKRHESESVWKSTF